MMDHPRPQRHLRLRLNLPGLCGSAYSWNLGQGLWVRLGRHGPGFSIRNTRKLFYEREGFVKSRRVGFGFRIVLLEAIS